METELLPNYSRFYLRSNPFPYVSVPDEEPSFYYDQEQALRNMLRVLSSTHATGNSNHAVLVGTYGSGKSHTLKHLVSRVKTQINHSNKKAIAFYVPHPGVGIIDVYRTVITQLGPSVFAKLASLVDDQSHYQFEIYRPIRMISQKSNEMLNVEMAYRRKARHLSEKQAGGRKKY